MSKQDESLSDMLAKLDETVAWFEQDDFDIEQAITKFEQGSQLATEIKARLDILENNVTVLKERFDS